MPPQIDYSTKLLCFPSLRELSSVLPDVHYLKTVVSFILSNLLAVYCVKASMVPFIPSWPQTEILCNLCNFILFSTIILEKYLAVSHKVKDILSICPVIALLDFYPREIKA